MANAFYTRMKGTADRLLTKYGFDIPLLDASQTVLATFKGLTATATEDNAPATLIKNGDQVVYVTYATVVPTVDHYVRVDGVIFKIISVVPVKPTDTGILHKLLISNGG